MAYKGQKQRPSNIEGRICLHCKRKISKSKRDGTKYCTSSCKVRAAQIRMEERARTDKAIAADDPGKHRKGGVLDKITDNAMAQQIADGTMTITAAAELIHATPAAVSRAMGAWRIVRAQEREADRWEMAPEVAAMFPVHLFTELRAVGLPAEGSDKFEALMFRLEFAFWQFEHRYFTIGSMQLKFKVYPFHVESIREFIVAHVFATKVLILTPPRHGKSEMVLRFVAWLIIMYPNIQILWVAATLPLAKGMTGKLKGVFQHSELLIAETLPKGKKYGDKRAPIWTASEFTLFTRTDHTLKSPTFTAIGSNATVAGRDADFIGIDDLEERKTVETHEQRVKSKRKHAEIMERQETHTGVVTIASRQHPDDIPATLMQQEGSMAWRVHSYPAHNDDCTLDDDVVAGHDKNGCVLAPEIVPYRILLEKKSGTETLAIPGRYELRYLQKSIPVDGMIFDIQLIREKCLDRSRIIGEIDLKVNYRLIAGMDPAPRGYQAAVLWAWTKYGTYLIDIVTTRGKGQLGAIQLFEDWFLKYGLTHWVYEDNMAKQDFFTRPDLIKVKDKYDLTIEKHTTGNEKRDAEVGISSMAPWYHSGQFVLPYGNAESVKKTKLLLSQLQLWTTDGLQKGATVTDIKMASWFPYVRRLVRWDRTERAVKLELVSDQSYPGLDGNTPSWGFTSYNNYGFERGQ